MTLSLLPDSQHVGMWYVATDINDGTSPHTAVNEIREVISIRLSADEGLTDQQKPKFGLSRVVILLPCLSPHSRHFTGNPDVATRAGRHCTCLELLTCHTSPTQGSWLMHASHFSISYRLTLSWSTCFSRCSSSVQQAYMIPQLWRHTSCRRGSAF